MKLLTFTVIFLSGVLADNSTTVSNKIISTVAAPTPSLTITPTQVLGSTSTEVNGKTTAVTPSITSNLSNNSTVHHRQSSTSSSMVIANDTRSTKLAFPSSNFIAPSTSNPQVSSSAVPKPNLEKVVSFVYPANDSCVNVTGDIHIKVQTNEAESLIYLDDKDFSTKGKCWQPNDTQSMISILYGKENGKGHNLIMYFQINASIWYLSNVIVTVNDSYSGKAKQDPRTNNNLYTAKSNYTYACTPQKSIPLISKDPKKYNLTVTFKKLEVKPFAGASSGIDFCISKTSSKDTSSIVPIAVGCALAGLIVIVLIAYLIGRRKGNNRGYQQV